MYYAGIGSRETPADVCELMGRIAGYLADLGWVLRSGHADGADLAFERGAKGMAEIYLPWKDFNSQYPLAGNPVCLQPAWFANHETMVEMGIRTQRDSRAVRLLMGRNWAQVMGHSGSPEPCKMVICWTVNAGLVGGTANAMRVAMAKGIKIFNLADPAVRQHIEGKLSGTSTPVG